MTIATDPQSEIPAWAESIRQKYRAGEASLFILYGNVFDRFWIGGTALSMGDFLAQILFQNKSRTILELSLGRGLRTIRSDVDRGSMSIPNDGDNTGTAGLLDAVEHMIFADRAVALLIPYAGTVLPNSETQFLSVDERVASTTLHRWSLDMEIAKRDAIVILIVESLAEINQSLVSNPRVASIEVPIPDQKARAQAIRCSAPKMSEEHVQALAEQMAGLRALQASSIVKSQSPQGLGEDERHNLILSMLKEQPAAVERAAMLAKITAGLSEHEIAKIVDPSKVGELASSPDEEMLRVVRARKREIIEKECSGLIEFIEPRQGLESVGGCGYIKNELLEIAKVFQEGDRMLSPMGLLAVGPMGAGKTYVIKAFVKEAGLVAVALKNFRSKWNGVTESNLDRVLATVKAMGPIAVIIDEGDRSFGNGGGQDTDGGTSSRVMARLKEFMSDTENRGRVLFILMTNRPDRLETDMKRPGRLDRKIPFFYAQTPGEQADIIKAVYQRYGIQTTIDWSQPDTLLKDMAGYSNADLEAVALLTLDLAKRQAKTVDADIFSAAAADFIPPREPQMIEFMELLAVQETSRRSLLPERFQKISTAELQDRLAVLSATFR
jgi:transitional endoplasmic reticulum ATPase